METRYLNTDLDLVATFDLKPLAAVLEAQGLWALQVTEKSAGHWVATFETDGDHAEAETTITAMLQVIEQLDGEARALWTQCRLREFNIGYDCGKQPSSFYNQLGHATLARIVAVGASMRITLYARESETAA